MYDSFITDEKISICFHKSCVDGLFSTIILLKILTKSNYTNSEFNLVPLSPTEISKKTDKIILLEHKKVARWNVNDYGAFR